MAMLAEVLDKDVNLKDGGTAKRGEILMAAAVKHAVEGNDKFFKTILDRYLGKVPNIIQGSISTNPFDDLPDSELDNIIDIEEKDENDDSDAN